MSFILNLFRRNMVPDRCPACRDTSGQVKASGHGWFHCDNCSKDFTGERDKDGNWRFDLRPARVRMRESQRRRASA